MCETPNEGKNIKNENDTRNKKKKEYCIFEIHALTLKHILTHTHTHTHAHTRVRACAHAHEGHSLPGSTLRAAIIVK